MKQVAVVLACCLVALWAPGSAQDLAKPIEKVTQMLEDMKSKSLKLKGEADSIYAKAKYSCDSTIQTKNDEVNDLDLKITMLNADVLQLETDINDLVAQINEDLLSHERNSKDLDYARKTRLKEESSYQRDLSEYSGALAAVQRAIGIMRNLEGTGGGGLNFLQAWQSRRSAHEARAALGELASSLRHSSIFTPDGSGLAKDEKIFEEFKSLTTNSATYTPGAGGGKGVIGVLEGLKSTFENAKDELMETEKGAKSAFSSAEDNLQQQLDTARANLSVNKATKAEKAETLIMKRGELKQASLNKDSASTFLVETEMVCKQRSSSYAEMNKLRSQEVVALIKAVEIIKGSVAADSSSPTSTVKGNVLMQTHSRSQSHLGIAQRFVETLNVFIHNEATKLHSTTLLRLGSRIIKVLGVQAPADAVEKVKKMISDLIVNLRKDVTLLNWCDNEFRKVEKRQQSAKADIDMQTASVRKIKGDLEQLDQDIALSKQTSEKHTMEETQRMQARAKEKEENEKTVKDAQDSITAVDAASTLISEYYKATPKVITLVQQSQPVKASNQASPSETPADITAADAQGPLVSEGANVIAMLDVVRDGYKMLVKKTQEADKMAEELYIAQSTDAKVMIATSEAEIRNKQQVIVQYSNMLPQTQSDLGASQTTLVDAETNYENLKAPCWDNKDPGKRRKQQIEGEIAALKEAEQMFETYQGTLLLQVARIALSSDQASNQVPASPFRIQRIVALLVGIRKDVQKDLDSDTAAYNDMQQWCTATITETVAAIKVQRDRDGELVTAIEVSTQQKTVLSTQLANLNDEIARNRESLGQMGQLRTSDMEAFHKAEKETMVAIASLRSAIIVLKGRYEESDKKDQRDFKAEREQHKAPPLELTHVADKVAQALKLLPVGEFNLALSGETGAILQRFLSRPDEVLPGSKLAGLTQIGSEVSSQDPGTTILGILESLMETFTADLQRMQGNEGQGIATYTSTKTAKQEQITALLSSIDTKQGQLAHYTTMNAQAKEDLAYLRQTNIFDAKYLQQVREQCRASDSEFAVRNKTQVEELAALSEAVSILTAGGPTSAPAKSDAQATELESPPALMAHVAKHVSRVFVHHHTSQKRRAVLKIKHPSTTLKPVATAAGDNRTVLQLSVTKASTPVTRKPGVTVAKLAPASIGHPVGLNAKTALLFLHEVAETRREAGVHSMDLPLHRSLAALESQVNLVHQQWSLGPLTNEAIRSVASKIDEVVGQLQTQKSLEIKKKDTCVSEKNDATQQREWRVAEKAKLDSEIIGFNAIVQSAADDMAAIAKQVAELNDTMVQATKTRQEAHVEYKVSVQDQVVHQEVLRKAIQALRDFFDTKQMAEKPGASLLLVSQINASVAAGSLDAKVKQLNSQAVGQNIIPQAATTAPIASNMSETKGLQVATPHVRLFNKLHGNVADAKIAAPKLNLTKDQEVLDDGVKSNMDTTWGTVKDVKANRSQAPKGFSKPLKAHGGGKGIIGILEMILEESVSLISQDVKDEQSAADLYLASVENSKSLITQKAKESIMLAQVKSDNELKKTQAEQQLQATETQIQEIVAFIAIVNNQCQIFLQNFDANQEARAQEISDTKHAKKVLLGMSGDN